MEKTEEYAKKKLEELVRSVTTDARWDLQDELMCQVFGFTAYGYIYSIGKEQCSLYVEDVNAIVCEQLTGAGIGSTYVEGLIEAAYGELTTENNESHYNNLINIGQSYASKEDITRLIESIFINTERVKEAMSPPA